MSCANLIWAWVTVAMATGGVTPEQSPGVFNGHLAACPSRPNCVLSQNPDRSRGLPSIGVTGAPADAVQAVRHVLSNLPRTRIVLQTEHYIHAEIRSAVFGFVDKVEFLIDGDSRLQFRSAARSGYWDLGVNRRRMARILKDLQVRFGHIFKATS